MHFTSYFRLFKCMVSFSRYFTVCITYQPLLLDYIGDIALLFAVHFVGFVALYKEN